MKNLGVSFVMSLFIGILLFNGVCNAQNKTQPCKTCDQQEMAFEQYNSQREMTGQSTLRLPEFNGGMDSLYILPKRDRVRWASPRCPCRRSSHPYR